MPLFPIKTCVVCSEEFELRPEKPGFANRCPSCTEEEMEAAARTEAPRTADAVERRTEVEVNEHRRKAIRDLLYRRED